MRIHTMLSSSAALAALCALLIGGCGGGTQSEDDGANPALRDGELGGSTAVGAPGEVASAPKGDQGPATGSDNADKITICHVPPGNPANAHTITVGRNGWNGHSRHKGDYAGPCGGSGGGEPDAGTSEPDAGTSEPDAGTSEPPVCIEADAPCGAGDTCCGGLVCRDGTCGTPIIVN